MIRSVTFDLVTISEGNERFATKAGMFAKSARIKAQRATTLEALKRLGAPPPLWFTPAGAAPSFTLPNKIELRCVRIGPGKLDGHDNLPIAFKAIVDAICEDWIGVRDNDPRIRVLPPLQERTPGVSEQGPCPVCLAESLQPCRETVPPQPMTSGVHSARRTPWRVRIEVVDMSPGEDRALVLASTSVQKRKVKKAKPPKVEAGPGGDEDRSARMLVPCQVHGAAIGEACGGKGRRVHGVCAARARLAGLVGVAAEVLRPASAGGPRRVIPAGSSSVVRVALPWKQNGGPPVLLVDSRLSTADRRAVYGVPVEHRARWGSTVTLFPRVVKAHGLGTITVFQVKEGQNG